MFFVLFRGKVKKIAVIIARSAWGLIAFQANITTATDVVCVWLALAGEGLEIKVNVL